MLVRVLAVAFLFGGALSWVGPSPASAAEVTVRIGDRLDPAEVSVASGTTVRWVNEDGERHRVRSSGGTASFDSGNLEPGESFSVTFSTAGRTTYVDDRDRSDTAYHGAVTVAEGGSGGSTSTSAPAPGQPAPTPTPPATATITMANRAFSPASVVVAPGATVTWANRDDRDHTGTADGGAFDTGNLGPGASTTTTHAAEGTFTFFCELHPEMTGVIRVSAASGAAAPAPPEPSPAPAPAAPPPAAAITPPPATPTPAGPASAGPTTRNVQMGDLFFAPATLDLRVGDTVVWANAGRAPHTATSSSFDSGRVAPGGSFRWTATAAGTIPYGCTIHLDMTGQLRIVAATAAAPPVAAASSPAATPAPAPLPLPLPPETGAPAEPAPEAEAPASATVDVQDFAFAPASVTVATGGTVTWSFSGAAPHTATGEGFDSGIVETGATFDHVFGEAGTFAYSCTVHPDMRGEVVVVETALIAATSSAAASPGASSPTTTTDGGATQAWTVALLGGASILGGTGALLLGARRFLLAS